MIVNQGQVGEVRLGKVDDVMEILEKLIEAGYGNLPAVWVIKLYLNRN